MTRLGLTASQTVGPFFEDALLRDRANVIARPGNVGERVRIEGRVLDGDGLPVPDAVVEVWQANEHGRYNHPLDRRDLPLVPDFLGFGRSDTDHNGRFWFDTIKPGRVPFDERVLQAPHLSLAIFARGLLNHLATRLYFEDDPANMADPLLQRLPESRRETLLARRESTPDGVVYRLDIVLQGSAETVFFDL